MFGKDFKYKIWDGLIQPNFLYELDMFTQSHNFNWHLTNRANVVKWKKFPESEEGTHLFWGSRLFSKEEGQQTVSVIPDSIFDLQNWFMDVYLSQFLENRWYFDIDYVGMNGQSLGMDGTTHKDGPTNEHVTLMYFVNHKWEENWGGPFQLMNENNTVMDQIDFTPGRFVFFKSNIPHRGLAPLEPMIVRKSLVWRGKLIEK